MIDLAIAALITQILIGAGQIGVVLYGISRMMEASRQRAQAGERQEREAKRHHTETMAVLKDQGQALQALIRGLETQGQALRDEGQALRDQRHALQTLIVRTGS